MDLTNALASNGNRGHKIVVNRNRTEKALIGRGLDSELAQALREKGWTLKTLMTVDDVTLRSLGLSDHTIGKIRKTDRPPVPPETLTKVLFANRWTCCVCRDSSRPIVVHHIEKWSVSHDHSAENLSVLCTPHHGEAHTTHELEVNLSPDRLRAAKLNWEAYTAKLDSLAIQQSTQLQQDSWLYFNHLRLLEIAIVNGVSLKKLKGYPEALTAGVCDKNGYIIKSARPSGFMYEDSDRIPLYTYMKSALYKLLDQTTTTNISDDLDRGTLNFLIVPGDLIYVQGVHTFSDIQTIPGGVQAVRAKRSANKVAITFDFDRREASSSSAWSNWLHGTQNVGSLVLVKNLSRSENRMQVTGTVIAIRNSLMELKQRTYEIGLYKSGIGVGHHMDDEEEGISDPADEEPVI